MSPKNHLYADRSHSPFGFGQDRAGKCLLWHHSIEAIENRSGDYPKHTTGSNPVINCLSFSTNVHAGGRAFERIVEDSLKKTEFLHTRVDCFLFMHDSAKVCFFLVEGDNLQSSSLET
jgi:hypothetical protein